MLQPGDIVGERYRLERELGAGGMAAVFEATDQMLDRKVAVKILFAKDERDRPLLARRFLREAKICAAVHHRHVVAITDFGTTRGDTPYMVMELLRGQSLGDLLARERKLSPGKALELAIQVLRGLNAVHHANIVHSDLKPDNIFLVEESDATYPKILDFGISRSVNSGSGRQSARTTSPGAVVGTPEYMSPEQARGLKEIDARTDIYSLGVILYEALLGRLPYESEHSGDLVILIATGGARELHTLDRSIPQSLSDVVAKAMEVDPNDRHPTARDMQAALLEAAREIDLHEIETTGAFGPVRSSRPPPPSTGQIARAASITRDTPAAIVAPPLEPVRRRRVLGVASAVGLIVAVGVGVASAWPRLRPDPPPATATVPSTAEPAPAEDPNTEPSTVEVLLVGMPREGELRVDGAISRLPIVLPRDGEPHVIEVTHPLMNPWSVTHVADVSGEYHVRIVPTPVAEAAGEGPIEIEEPPRRRGRGTMRRGTMMEAATDMPAEEGAPSTFRELDY